MENCYINIIEHEIEFSSECLILKSHIKKITDEENEETEIRKHHLPESDPHQ